MRFIWGMMAFDKWEKSVVGSTDMKYGYMRRLSATGIAV